MPVLVGSAFSTYVLNAGRSKNWNGLSVLHINIAAFQFIFEQHMTVPWVTTNDTTQNVKRRDQTALYSPKDVRTARALLWTIDEPAAPQRACFFLPPLSFLFSRNFLHSPLISTSLPPPLFTPCFLSSFPHLHPHFLLSYSSSPVGHQNPLQAELIHGSVPHRWKARRHAYKSTLPRSRARTGTHKHTHIQTHAHIHSKTTPHAYIAYQRHG